MCTVLFKDTIEMEKAPLIPKAKASFPTTVPLHEIINTIVQTKGGCLMVSITS